MTISKKEKLEIIQNILNGLEEYWLDTQGFIYATNLEAINIMGYEEAEMIGKHFSILYPKEARENNEAEMDLQVVMEQGYYKTKSIRVKKSNIKFLAKVNLELARKDSPRTGIKMTIQDITYSTIQNHKLKHLESHYNSLFHNHFVGVLNLDDQGFKILLANVKACEMLGEYELTSKSFGNYLKQPGTLDFFERVTHMTDGDHFELPLTKADGKVIWARMRCSFFEVEGLIEVLLFDITEEKNRIRELERINQHLDQFIYHVSHDLRSPLTTLLGLIDLAKKGNIASPDTLNYVSLMEDRVRHLDTIIVDLTSIAFNEKASVDLNEIYFEEEVKSIVGELGHSTLQFHLSIQQANRFYTDIKRFRIILRNLLSNAFKYFNPVEASPYVKLSIFTDAEKVTLEVEDNGMGIHPTFNEKIFEMFFRATTRSSGSGLGLYIVKSIVNKLNGSITVKSSIGQGSTFRVILPNNLRQKDSVGVL
jgi:PAS domain S-box-containing protein